MPQGPDFRQYFDQALQLGVLTRAQAQKITKDLVREGQLAQERAQGYVDELIDRSRKRTEDLVDLVRKEVRSQIAALGMATKDDIARLEKRIAQASGEASAAKPAKAAKAAKEPAKKKSAGKAGGAAKANKKVAGSAPTTATLPGTTEP